MSDSALLPHILDLASLPRQSLPQDARKMAQLSLFDWMVVSLAGADQPLAHIIRDFVMAEGGVPSATITGAAVRLPARAAALANGTISHALDYDDTHFAYIGHPSVAIFPAALAAAGLRGSDFITGWKRREEPLDIGFIDESSMLEDRQFDDLREIFSTLVLFGDPAQLAPVGQSGTMVFERLPAPAQLQLSRRQQIRTPA